MATTITIGGIDKSGLVLLPSIRINDVITQRINTCSFQLITESSYIPEDGLEVIITSGGVRIFGGYIVKRTSKVINSLRVLYNLDCQDYTLLFYHKLSIVTVENETCKYAMEYLINTYCASYGITTTNIETGPTLNRIQFNYVTIADAFKKICDYTGYDWYIDYYKNVYFFMAQNNPASFEVNDSAAVSNLEINRDLTQIKNAIYVRGASYISDIYTQNMVGDGTTKDFYLTYKPHDLTITIGGASKTVGTDNIHDLSSYDSLVNFQEKMVKFASAPGAGVAIVFTYKYDVPILVYKRDPQSVAALVALGDVDGIREKRIIDNSIKSREEARQKAEGELLQSSNPKYTASYETSTSGLKSGMIQKVNSVLLGINENLVITEITTAIGFNDNHNYFVRLEGRLYGLTELLKSFLDKSSELADRNDEVLDKILVHFENARLSDSNVITKLNPPHKYGTAKYAFSEYGDIISHDYYKYGSAKYGTATYN
ncbi:MAG: hypothetical protein ACYCXQ_01020 [Candidatus Humimicrobiaceae bacterium]